MTKVTNILKHLQLKGGEGSGNFDHDGRPGEVGGSGDGGGNALPSSSESSKANTPNTPEKPKKGDYTIEKETPKAYLISKDGKKMWIQKRWINDEGKLTKGAQGKFDNTLTDVQQKQAIEDAHTINGQKYNVWKPSDEKGRLYFADKSYIDASTTEATPHGYYENHRFAKGERNHVMFVKASGGLAKESLPYLEHKHLGPFKHFFGETKVMVQNGDKWEQLSGGSD